MTQPEYPNYARSNIKRTDGYKPSHWLQTAPGTTLASSYFASRGGAFKEVMLYSLQGRMKRILGQRIVPADIPNAKRRFGKLFKTTEFFAEALWEKMITQWGGYFPMRIYAVPEGLPLPTGLPLIRVENRPDAPEFSWTPNYNETQLSRVWAPSTVGTQSREMARIILKYLEDTGDPSLLPWKLHCFGGRGVSCEQEAEESGSAHLLNFRGSDTVEALDYIEEFYHYDDAADTIPASEHWTITSWGRTREIEACRNMIKRYGHLPFYANVSDSYNVYELVEKGYCRDLKLDILEATGTLVVRPDSGNPLTVIPKLADLLEEGFGSANNAKGYKVLHPKVRLIQGDGIDRHSISDILWSLTTHGFSADNLAFGSGGGLLRKVDRDTCKFKFAGSYTENDFGKLNVFKSPIDQPDKVSMGGRMTTIQTPEGEYKAIDLNEYVGRPLPGIDLLAPVWDTGHLLRDEHFLTLRARAALTESGLQGVPAMRRAA